MMAELEDEYFKYLQDALEQGIEPMSMQQFVDQAIAESQMSGGQPLPSDPTKPVNPFQPKPTGPTLPDRQMAAYGGIMGLDGRKKYGIGSWFQEKIMDPIKENPLLTAAAAAYGYDTFKGDGVVNDKISSIWEKLNEKKQGNKIYKEVEGKPVWTGKYEENPSILRNIGSALTDNIVPIVGGLTAGLFTKIKVVDKI